MEEKTPFRSIGQHTINVNFIVAISPIDAAGSELRWRMELSNGDTFIFDTPTGPLYKWLRGEDGYTLQLVSFKPGGANTESA